ncbi:MAG: hypothetical protein ACFFA5_02065 [Promethearchaeota archaeon]
MPACPRCRRTLREGLRFCTFCGSPLFSLSKPTPTTRASMLLIEEGKKKEKLANYICVHCGKFANFYCPEHGVFCKHCASKKISFCPSCGVGFQSAPPNAKCQTILNSLCPQCGKQLVLTQFQKGGVFDSAAPDYKVTCVACGWESSKSKPKIVEDNLADIFNQLNKKKLIQTGAHPVLCNRNLVNTGCPVCNRMGIPILRVLPSINVETVEAVKIGNQIPLTLTITAKLPTELKLHFPVLNEDISVSLRKDETEEIELELPTGEVGVFAMRAQATITAGNFQPTSTDVNLTPVFVLPNIEIDREAKALYIDHEGLISVDIRNKSDFEVTNIEVKTDFPSEFEVGNGNGKHIERIRPGTYRAVDFKVTPTIGGLYSLNPTEILFNAPKIFKSQKLAIYSEPLTIEIGRAYMDIVDPVTAAAVSEGNNSKPTEMIIKERVIEKKEEVILIKTVPTTCSECGAPLSEESVDWVGPEKFKCPTCGSTLSMKLERQKSV